MQIDPFCYGTTAKRRSAKGFSLVMVMSIGLIGLMGSMAVTSMLFSGKRYSDQTQIQARVLHDAEVAANYAIYVLCQAKKNGIIDKIGPTISLPKELNGQLNTQMSSSPHSAIDDPQQIKIDAKNATYSGTVLSLKNEATLSLTPDIRQITVKSKLNNVQKKLVITIAIFDPSQIRAEGGSGSGGNNSGADDSIFKSALQTNGKLTLNNVNIQPAGSDTDFSKPYLVSNNNFSFNNQGVLTRIPGSLNVYNPNPSANNPTLNIGSGLEIGGNLNFNGSANDGYTPKLEQTGDGGVLGDGIPGNNNATIGSNPSLTNSPYVPSQKATESAQIETTTIYSNTQSGQVPLEVVNDISLSSNGGIGQIPPLSSAISNNISAPTMTINMDPGSYITNSVNLKSTESLSISGPTQIYIQDTLLNTTAAVSMNGNIKFLTNDANMMIIYGGTKQLNLDLSNMSSNTFKGQIYAPNSNVNINLAGKTFQGAVTANDLNMSSTSGGGGKGLFSFDDGGASAIAPLKTTVSYQRISWVESNTW